MFKENFVRLCASRGKAPSTVCIEIGLSGNAYSEWKDTTIPRRTTLVKISDYFNVPVSDLLDDPAPTDRMLRLPINERTISDEEYEIIVAMRRQPETIPFIRRLLSLPEAEKKKAES